MNRLLRQAWRRSLWHLSGPGLLALGLLGITLAIALWLPPLQQRSEELRAALAARVELATAPVVPAPPRKTRLELAAEFIDGLPMLAQSASDLDKVFALAARRKLALPKGDYQLKQEPNAALASYIVTFPVRSEYGALKDFVADVLEALPHAAMDDLRMSRPDAASVVLDSMVRFTFAYRSQ